MINDTDADGKSRELISIEAVHGEWVINSNNKVSVLNASNEIINNTILKPLTFLNLNINYKNEKAIIILNQFLKVDKSSIKSL